jgi:hypothetical protein
MMDSTYRWLLRGKGAHADPIAILADVPASAAGRLMEGYPHSIWQMVGHMNYWMQYELERIAGKKPHYPEHAIEKLASGIAPRDVRSGATRARTWRRGSICCRRCRNRVQRFSRLRSTRCTRKKNRVPRAWNPFCGRSW